MKNLFSSRKGSAAIEFAIILPLLLVLIFGLIEFGLLMFNKQIITNASREGARTGIVYSRTRVDEATIKSIVKTYANNYLVNFGGSKTLSDGDITVSAICANSGDNLSVSITYNYYYLMAGKLIPGLTNPNPISAASVMRCE